MNNNDSNDRDMERLLGQHFASGADKVPPTPDLWASLEGRLGEQDPKPVWAGIRDWAFPPGGFNGVPPLAATAAAVVVVAIAGSVWFAVGGRDVRTTTVVETVIVEKPVTVVEKVVETVVVEKQVSGQTVKVVETVIVEKPVTRVEKVVETVVVEKVVEGQTVKVVETVIVEKPVTRVEKVVETVVVEKAVRVLSTPAAAMMVTAAPAPTAMPAATGVPAPAPRPTGTPAAPGALIDPDGEQRVFAESTGRDHVRGLRTSTSDRRQRRRRFHLQPGYGPHILPIGIELGQVRLPGGSRVGASRGVGERIRLRLCCPFSRMTGSPSRRTCSSTRSTTAGTWRGWPSKRRKW